MESDRIWKVNLQLTNRDSFSRIATHGIHLYNHNQKSVLGALNISIERHHMYKDALESLPTPTVKLSKENWYFAGLCIKPFTQTTKQNIIISNQISTIYSCEKYWKNSKSIFSCLIVVHSPLGRAFIHIRNAFVTSCINSYFVLLCFQVKLAIFINKLKMVYVLLLYVLNVRLSNKRSGTSYRIYFQIALRTHVILYTLCHYH